MAYAVVIGGGKIGYYLTKSLINKDYEVLLLEKDDATYHRLADDLGDVVMQGDGCDPLTLKAAGIKRADLVVAATGDDADNLITSQMAALCFGRGRIIARVNNPANEELFEQLGIHERISGTGAILNLITQKVGRAPVILLGALERSNLEVVELLVDEQSPLCGATLGEIHLPEKTLIISVLRNGEGSVPDGHTVFQSGDVLVALIPQEFEALLREFIV